MHHIFLTLFFSFYSLSCFGNVVKWNGYVNSDGSPSPAIELTLKKKYQVEVSGTINLGKWMQQGKKLGYDACYLYADSIDPDKVETLKNSLEISVCDGRYHPDHLYLSEPFIAEKSKIHFWVSDHDYTDNSGSFLVRVIELE